jgi:putative redox protein
MHATVSWQGESLDDHTSGMAFTAVTGSGHVLTMDGAPAEAGSPLGGRNLAPRPMEVVLAGTGGCTAYDVVLILRRGRHVVTRCEVTLEAERAPTDPKVFTTIHFHFTVVGRALKPEAVDRAIKLSHEKLCSASIMLAKTATLTHSFEIREG